MPQEPFLFAGTIRENICFDVETPKTDLDKAIEGAALTDTIRSFPDGVDTVVGEKGVVLSGGQRQRVALARALLKPAPILILDDPISQVDTETANHIIRTIRDSAEARTMIIISHRLSVLTFADRIISMENGTIAESGTHAQLSVSGGYYARTLKIQAMEEMLHAL